jgi:protein phosphatase
MAQISQDHTYVQTLVDAGLARPEDMAHHPWRSVVLRSVHGAPDADLTDIDILEVDTRPGDRLLLCSDGLTDLVDDQRIAEVLRMRDPHSAAAVLTQAAIEAGGRDNITCVVLDVVDGPLVVGDGRLLGAVADIDNIVDPAYVKGA